MAWLIAFAADALQLAVVPLFVEGALSPVDAVLDAGVAIMLVRLLGWHWAFLPTLMVEALPGADLFPTWTAAVFFVTRQMHQLRRARHPAAGASQPHAGVKRA